ncbi:MAG: hypothetical protein ACOYMA_12285 [Bacteroidia bacterium]
MKKLIMFLMLCVAFTLSAQKITPTVWSYAYTGIASDTIGAVTTTWTKSVEIATPYQSSYVVQLKISDKVAGAAATVVLKGKNFATDTYATITTVTWTGTGSTDSVITFNSTTNKYNYNYLQVLVTRTANKATINWFKAYVKQ